MRDLVIDHSDVDLATMKKFFHLFYVNRGKLHMSLEEYEKFLLTATYFDGSEITEEEKQKLDSIPSEAMREIISSDWYRVSGSFFKEKLMTSECWRNLKNVEIQNVFPAMFDFKNPKEVDRFNYSILGIQMGSDLEKARDLFLEKALHLTGFCNFGKGMYFICINTKSTVIEQTIRHALIHFLQTECGIEIIKRIDNTRQEDFPSFNLKEVVDYFSDDEFISHMQDIIDDISRCKEKFYNEMNLVDFWILILNMSCYKTGKEFLENDLFIKMLEANSEDTSAIMMLAYSWMSGYRWHKILDNLQGSTFSHK